MLLFQLYKLLNCSIVLRADKLNSMNVEMWEEMSQCFKKASNDSDVRSIVLSGKGRMFTCGLDLMEAAQQLPK